MAVLLPAGQLYTGKDETHGIERDNARQRHWLARFRRRSIVVSKATRMVDVSQQLDLTAERRLGHIQPLSCPAEMEISGDRNKAAQLMQLEH
jgi:hypothetical protein